ncbi:MAG: polyhydroxyalkanoic acid system family protein [Bdellovibrionaceae bacterium]|nr:polyhydroxyalkanoic acid system family protein [Pseudobdellovibrionaceae bacterium]
MPKLKVESQSKYSATETFKKIKQMLETDRDLQKLDAGYKCTFNEGNMTGTAKGSRFEANMKVAAAGTGSQVQIEVDLPLILSPMKGVVQSTLQKKLESTLA